MTSNWTFGHDDHAPFGSDEHINITEYRSLLITIFFFMIGLFLLIYHLINSIIRYKALPENDTDIMTGLINISTVCCKLLTYIVRISTLMSHWLIILLLLNRLFLVYSKFYRLIAIVNAKYAV
jgi:hypothetical protein